jgi:orotidine-5'-phosphate decarboxylase
MQSPEHPFDRLQDRCRKLGSIVCAGFDPHPGDLPAAFRTDPPVTGVRRFLFAVLEALADVVPVIKPQIAFFEQLGADGIALYFELIREAHRENLLVIGDIKRSDIGSTAAAYAAAHLGPTDGSAADFVTLNPYLGLDGIAPFLEIGRKTGRGVFVLARTSNASAAELQDLVIDGVPLYERVGAAIEKWGSAWRGTHRFGDCGAVVGATHPEQLARLRAAFPSTFFLVPGFGAQGGTATDVVAAFRADDAGAVINSSRGILFAGKGRPDADARGVELARQAAIDMNREIAAALLRRKAARAGT